MGDQVELIDLSPPSREEVAFRDGMARFDQDWQREQATANTKAGNWFSAAFHWGQLAEHDPRDEEAWKHLEAACDGLGDWHPAVAVCDRLLRHDPTRGSAYLRRARLRAKALEFFEAAADAMAGLALTARAGGGPQTQR